MHPSTTQTLVSDPEVLKALASCADTSKSQAIRIHDLQLALAHMNLVVELFIIATIGMIAVIGFLAYERSEYRNLAYKNLNIRARGFEHKLDEAMRNVVGVINHNK